MLILVVPQAELIGGWGLEGEGGGEATLWRVDLYHTLIQKIWKFPSRDLGR